MRTPELFYISSKLIGDPTSGAAIAAADLLRGLSNQGFAVGPNLHEATPESTRAEAREFVGTARGNGSRRILMGYGNETFLLDLFAEAHRNGIVTILHIHNFYYRSIPSPDIFDHIIVPSRYAADYYRDALGLECHVLPNLIDPARVVPSERSPT